MVTAAARQVPVELLDELRVGGVMVLPLQTDDGGQKLVRITRRDDGYDDEQLLNVRFVPLVEGTAREL
jgi:protein-L-isoaspartate(D-aspartate) O-methyltransferase